MPQHLHLHARKTRSKYEQKLSIPHTGVNIYEIEKRNISRTDFSSTSIKRLTLTATTEVKIFADGHYVGKTENWDYPYVVDISANSQVIQFFGTKPKNR